MSILAIYNHSMETLGTLKKFLPRVKEIMAEELKGDEQFEALIIMGGPMGVYERDKYHFLNVEMELVKNAYKQNKRVLGICLGSQLIAEALGGKVIKGGFGQEIGVQKVRLLGELKDFMGSEELLVFQWHGDTFSLPENGVLLGYSNKYFQVFRLKRTLGIQFHVEVDSEMISKWVKLYGGNESMVEDVKKFENELKNSASKLIKYWMKL
ncbi:type 1 glutamine amidotransferase [Saccharolobus islandicus]|uniref:GMP synthase-Glutamine amidotransferase domain protein n=3 Tax=Saccharolobus islandicus TaxID=43080 RepID=M9U548_SACIS|nr:GMP synthase [Sulfolobus islandicus]ADX82048.1 glutamine amidotransferase class-I [Sulfolobus islandicus HVE10/4]ADX84723.1 glutamine amidotransferase class-I [Sulfolobus islandicus REY15A]AGJ62139.1 GMP synthase - Glutamine amidotransferase domain protein [Sulfolobus islandicus LAL14/1]WCM36615.1 GMP synthase [Sulfolobus islandicus]